MSHLRGKQYLTAAEVVQYLDNPNDDSGWKFSDDEDDNEDMVRYLSYCIKCVIL